MFYIARKNHSYHNYHISLIAVIICEQFVVDSRKFVGYSVYLKRAVELVLF